MTGATTIAPLLPPLAASATAQQSGEPRPNFSFTLHAREVLRAAANRIIPPFDNGTLPRFAGAGDEGAVEYIETLLTAFDFVPPRIYSGGRTSTDPTGAPVPGCPPACPTECQGGHLVVVGDWIDMPPEKEIGWRKAIAEFQRLYEFALGKANADGTDQDGQLDADSKRLFGAGFLEIRPAEQTLLLESYDAANNLSRVSGVYTAGGGEAALQTTFGSEPDSAKFMNLLFVHVIEAIYGDPIYRGATPDKRPGWKLAGFGGPHHPQAFSEEDLETYGNCDLGFPANLDFPDDL